MSSWWLTWMSVWSFIALGTTWAKCGLIATRSWRNPCRWLCSIKTQCRCVSKYRVWTSVIDCITHFYFLLQTKFKLCLLAGSLWVAEVSRAQIHWGVHGWNWPGIGQRSAVWSQGELLFVLKCNNVCSSWWWSPRKNHCCGFVSRIHPNKTSACLWWLYFTSPVYVFSGIQARTLPEENRDRKPEPPLCVPTLTRLGASRLRLTPVWL